MIVGILYIGSLYEYGYTFYNGLSIRIIIRLWEENIQGFGLLL